MFQMLLKILAFSEFVGNVNNSPSPVLYQSENDTTHQGENNTTHQWGNDTVAYNTTPTINPETEIGLHQARSKDYYSTVAIVEGDIIMNEDRNAVSNIWRRREEVGVDGSISITVPIAYEIEDKLETRKTAIAKAMKMISDVTCVTFHERKEGNEDDNNYLMFRYNVNGCASYVGCIGGGQLLYVGPFCVIGNVCHEIIHALGFNHEQTRPDHKEYIEIVYENIIPRMRKNFLTVHGTLHTEYDTCSIMHYGPKFFSRNGKDTIIDNTSVDCGFKMGQRTNLTKLDIEKVRRLYNCDGNAEE